MSTLAIFNPDTTNCGIQKFTTITGFDGNVVRPLTKSIYKDFKSENTWLERLYDII